MTKVQEGQLELADVRRRLSAIFVGSIGNLVEWYDFYAYAAFALYFASAFFPGQRSRRPAAERRDPLCVRLHRAAHRRMAVRTSGRSLRPPQCADAVGAADVLRVADDRGDADLRDDRHRRARHARPRAHDSGPEPRRRVRHERDVPHRGRRREASRLLLELPVRHADRRPVVRHPRAAAPAAGLSHAGAAEGVGLADSVRHRRAAGDRRAADAAQSARDRGLHRLEEADDAEDELDRGACEISARSARRRRPDDGRDDGVLHLHDLHAEVPEAVGRPQRHPDDAS